MKSLRNILLIGAATLYLTSCSSNTNVAETTESTDSILTATDQHENHEHEEIVLDNGNKWKVVDHMLLFIRSIEKDVQEFPQNVGEKKLDDYQLLSNKIADNLDSLTSNCTMTGQAHDELHKWLLPFLDLSDYFAKSKTIQEADSLYKEISASFKEFNLFFE